MEPKLYIAVICSHENFEYFVSGVMGRARTIGVYSRPSKNRIIMENIVFYNVTTIEQVHGIEFVGLIFGPQAYALPEFRMLTEYVITHIRSA